MIRERDVFDLALAVPVDYRPGDLIEGLGPAGADVENAALLRVIEKPEVHVDHVADIDEIALLLAVRVAVDPFEQAGFFLLAHLAVEMKRGAAHRALVLFPRPVDVEITEARDRGPGLGQDLPHVLVELKLRVGVHVDRLLAGALDPKAVLAAAIHRGRRGIIERRIFGDAPVQDALRVIVIVLHHEAAVPLGRRRAGPLMEDTPYLVQEARRIELLDELVLVQIIGDVEIGQIVHLAAVQQIVDQQDIALAAFVQCLDQIAADKAGAARDYDHAVPLALLIIDVVDCPSTNCKILTSPPALITQSPPAT